MVELDLDAVALTDGTMMARSLAQEAGDACGFCGCWLVDDEKIDNRRQCQVLCVDCVKMFKVGLGTGVDVCPL